MIPTLRKTDIEQIHVAAKLLSDNLRYRTTIPMLATKLMMPEKKLKAGFRKEYKMGVYAYLKKMRMEKAKDLLLSGRSVKEVSWEVGYKEESAFIKAFKSIEGDSPAAWLREIESRQTKTA
jgi:transcriptional regulator GlxA family with amidase domain